MSITKFFVNIINNATYVKNSIYLWFKGVSMKLLCLIASPPETNITSGMYFISFHFYGLCILWLHKYCFILSLCTFFSNCKNVYMTNNIFLQKNILSSHNFMLCLAQIINLLLKSLLLVNHNAILENKYVMDQ